MCIEKMQEGKLTLSFRIIFSAKKQFFYMTAEKKKIRLWKKGDYL